MNNTGNITDPKTTLTNENRLVRVAGALQVMALLINIGSLAGFCMHWSVRWKWAKSNTGEHIKMMVTVAIIIASFAFAENVTSGFNRASHFVIPADTPCTFFAPNLLDKERKDSSDRHSRHPSPSRVLRLPRYHIL